MCDDQRNGHRLLVFEGQRNRCKNGTKNVSNSVQSGRANREDRMMNCWNCSKKGNFAGQLCDECFKKMERDYETEQEEKWAETHYGGDKE